ncbi:MAG TPA: hypothetical protein VHJ58_06970 [Vicinamibacterales bacterium]|jgi:hypothetical protein|nr:hypothetical protein [Vicinamibacterales bacterium]
MAFDRAQYTPEGFLRAHSRLRHSHKVLRVLRVLRVLKVLKVLKVLRC